MKLIGLVGKAGSGKDSAAAMIPGARRFSFADPLKEFCRDVFGWDRETLWGPSELRNKPDPRYVRPDGTLLTPRYALQQLGTQWGRDCCPDVWALAGVRRAQESGASVAVFTDCRFVNEAFAISAAGGEVWRIVRPGAGLADSAGAHASELEQDSPNMDVLIDRTIYNTGSLEDLRAAIVGLL